MFKRALFCSIIALTVGACGKDSDNNNGSKVVRLPHAELKPATTAADCDGPNSSYLNSRWSTLMTSPNIQVMMQFNFLSTYEAELVVTCYYPTGSQLSARVRAPYSSTNSTVTFHQTKTREEKTSDMSCSATIHANTAQYHFERACLVFTDPNDGQKIYFTPQ